MAKKRRITYRLRKLRQYANEHRDSPYLTQIVKWEWLYNHGSRSEYAEKQIYHLYEEVKP